MAGLPAEFLWPSTDPANAPTRREFGRISAKDSAARGLTGYGLQTLDAVNGHCGVPREIKPSLREFEILLAAGDKSLVEA